MLAGRAWWLIVRDGGNLLEPLCVYAGVERVLPVFSFEEEAELFLRLGGYDGHWRARKSCADELVSVLCGSCKGVKSVALDPLPEMLEDGTLALVGVGRQRFLKQILVREKRTTAP
jgi:hypothetical protein